ncbi:uncharacterized protein A4U43_C03F9680 [Asparagus officinalis]|uniref:Bifunctional inhibitor/plant lipid transfer protein/seed storage helical domain-containing protein n=1 Tax=Asparagus officinalis TaxID=4686 RepID=A0A5P1FBG3_ASPOF|nr:2S albumin-like [Asparagus officinalis]XP_020256548.1 2S albumin-like [Asparagus officinalis]ONK74737.1 uncharacterized protein A4U43_C03F9640 [Asparagus officinalis]ONK74741.1 uncharacterized protein A4U43_C03F9680 [Asparagus officinalis]
MKPITITLFLLLALAASAAAFTSEEDASESTCTREMRRHPLDKYCRSFVKQGRRGGSQGEIMMVDDEDDDDGEGAPEECCNQLRRVKEECRCPAVRRMTREIMQQEGKGSVEECRGGRCGEMMMRGMFLPAICGMEPRTCRMRQRTI